jgi:hypothetical protein
MAASVAIRRLAAAVAAGRRRGVGFPDSQAGGRRRRRCRRRLQADVREGISLGGRHDASGRRPQGHDGPATPRGERHDGVGIRPQGPLWDSMEKTTTPRGETPPTRPGSGLIRNTPPGRESIGGPPGGSCPLRGEIRDRDETADRPACIGPRTPAQVWEAGRRHRLEHCASNGDLGQSAKKPRPFSSKSNSRLLCAH